MQTNELNNDFQPEMDEAKLMKRASLRAGFKMHLTIYLLVNLLFWVIWYFVFRDMGAEVNAAVLKAILFLTVVWFIAILGHFFIAYRWNRSLVEKELVKLKKEIAKAKEEVARLKEEKENEIKS